MLHMYMYGIPRKLNLDLFVYNKYGTMRTEWTHSFVVQETFLSKLLISVKKQQKIELTKEQGWYSESELSELGWSQSDTHIT